MRSLAVATVCVVAIILTPAPSAAKVVVLVPVVVALFMVALDAALTARAQIAAARYQEDRANALVVSWLGELRDEIHADEVEWQEWLGRIPTDKPLASVTPLPTRARVINLPSQRRPEAGA